MFWWRDSGIEKQSSGRTRDISEMGAFVLANTCPPSGMEIGFKVFLPVLPGFESNARVEAVGQVQRVEQAGGLEGHQGFAISTLHTLLRFTNNANELEESSKNRSQVS